MFLIKNCKLLCVALLVQSLFQILLISLVSHCEISTSVQKSVIYFTFQEEVIHGSV